MRSNRDRARYTAYTLIIFIILVFGVLYAAFAGLMVGTSEALRAAQIQGFDHVEVRNTARFFPAIRMGCDERDAAGFEMSGTNARNEPVDFTVCCGWPFKGCTIRTR